MKRDDYQALTRETSGSDDLCVLALGLIGETVEFLDTVNSLDLRLTREQDFANIVDEAGDVLWYAARICDVLEVSFGDLLHQHQSSHGHLSAHRFYENRFLIVKDAASVSEHVKKVVGHGHEIDTPLLSSKIADVVLGVGAVVSVVACDDPPAESSLAYVMQRNIKKLRNRYPRGFSTSDSINR